MDDSYIRVFQNCIKAVFSLYADDSSLQKIDCDFKAVKCIFDHQKRYSWSENRPVAYRLIHDIDTGCGDFFLVKERLMKSSSQDVDTVIS